MKTNFNDKDGFNGRELLESSVSVDDIIRKVVINHLVVDSPELFELLRKCDTNIERIAETRKVIDIGSFVKNKVQMAVDTDYFDRRVSDMTGEFEKGLDTVKSDLLAVIEQKFDPSKSDSYTDKIQKFFDQKKTEFEKQIRDSLLELANGKKVICEKINESFDPDSKSSHISKFMENVDKLHATIKADFDLNKAGSITHQMKELIKETLGEDGQLAKSIDNRLSFDNPKSTIAILQDNLTKKLDEIKSELVSTRSAAEAEKAALEKSIQKGFDFEGILMEQLEEFARQRGDLVEDVSNVIGEITRGKKGDFLYTLTSLNKIIAIEAKNGEMPTPKNVLELMDKTMINRKADYVICIYAEESQLHNQVGSFQEYVPDKLVTHFGLLAIALKVAISRLLLDTAVIDGIDRAATEKEIETIKNSLQSFRTIKTAATNILNQSQKIKDQAGQIRNEISTSLDILTELLLTSENQSN